MNRHTKEIPGSELKEVSFDENISVFENMLYILGIIDHNGRGQGGHRNFEGAEADFVLTFGEPIEELVPWLQEPYAIAGQRQCPRWTSARSLAICEPD